LTKSIQGRRSSIQRRAAAQRGLTIIELLVAVTLGLVLVGAVLFTYLGSRGAFRATKSTARVQEAGRFGLDAIARDVRQAGYLGCGSRVSLKNLQAPSILQLASPQLAVTNPTWAVFEPARTGPTTWTPTWTPPAPATTVASQDILILHTSSGTASLPMSQAPNFATPAIFLANNCPKNIKMDSYIMLANCSMATVLRVSNKPDESAASCPSSGVVASGVEVDFAATDLSGTTINIFPNSTPTLMLPVAGSTVAAAPTLLSRPSVQVFDEVTYFVSRIPGRPWNALYRFPLSNGAIGPEEIIDHVDDMCVLYGVRNGNVVTAQTAANVPANGGWDQVVDVRVSLLATGEEQGVVDATQQPSFPWCGGTKQATDTYYHQVFTSTIALRDRLP